MDTSRPRIFNARKNRRFEGQRRYAVYSYWHGAFALQIARMGFPLLPDSVLLWRYMIGQRQVCHRNVLAFV